MDKKDDLLPEKRDMMIGIKLTPTEHQEFQKYCDNLGITMSRYVRHLIKSEMDSK